jgi:hypothetical protein
MAKSVSDRLIKDVYVFPKLSILHIKIKTRNFSKFLRSALIKLLPNPKYKKNCNKVSIVDEFEAGKDHLEKETFGYCDQVWNDDFYQDLIEQWPPTRYFQPLQYITKSYDVGYLDDETLTLFPAYEAAYRYLKSEEFCARVTSLVGDHEERECYQILLTKAYSGSSIVPHIDSSNMDGSFNFVIFLNASEGPNSGGLAFWRDNEFKDLVFEPTKLRNSGVYYLMNQDLYHGFPPMRSGSFRWTINATYKKKKHISSEILS